MIVDLRAVVGTDIRREAMLIYATLLNDTHAYIPEIESGVSKSFINFSGYAMDNWLEANNNDFDIELNGGE
jgi:hypothetical protein